MSKYGVTEEDSDQLYAEIENEGFDYWLTNYASSSPELKRYPELYQKTLKVADMLEELEEEFRSEGILE